MGAGFLERGMGLKQRKGEQEAKAPVFLKKTDVLIIGAILLAALAAGLLFWARGAGGAVALVTVTRKDGAQQVRRIPLNADGLVEIEAQLPVRLMVEDGSIRFVDSVCPDHDCEGFGRLRREGDWAACLPAGVVVQIDVRQ